LSRAGSYLDELQDGVEGGGRRIAVVVSRFNGHITDMLLESARSTLLEHGVDEDDVTVWRVPGAWELPQAAAAAAGTGRFDAVIALGCVIRGETPHFDFIAGETARGLGAVGRHSGVPTIFGVLTTDTDAQAVERADPRGQDKGREAALSALEMAALLERIREPVE
jgi:6,7-dimethyl-8-ribityllumazine synthase